MQLEVGKYYRTRDGRKVGPCRGPSACAFYTAANNRVVLEYFSDGLALSDDSCDDIIAEWADIPAYHILSLDTVNALTVDNLRFHSSKELEPLQKEAFRIVLRYYGVTL